jgi:hypothetical protein
VSGKCLEWIESGVGEPCRQPFRCDEERAHCNGETKRCEAWVQVRAGEDCSAPAVCEEHLYCDEDGGPTICRAVPIVGAGETCGCGTFLSQPQTACDSARCAEELYCEHNVTTNDQGTSTFGICRVGLPGSEGHACGASEDAPCAEGLGCREGRCQRC